VMDSAWTTACMPLDLPRPPADDTNYTPIGYTTSLTGGPMRRDDVYWCQMTPPQME
jgi:hypothetical protein